jgi:hypothetical protein
VAQRSVENSAAEVAMKLKVASVLLVLAIIGGSVLLAQQGQRPETPAADSQVEQLVRDLDSNSFDTRRRAHEELLKVGKAGLPALKKALAAKPNLEVASRLRDIIRKLSIRDDAGPASGNLQVRLVSDRKAIKVGDTVRFTVTLFNLGEEDLNVQVGYSTCGNYFECGSAFQRLDAGASKEGKPMASRCRVGFCGTGAGPLIVTVPAEGSVEYVSEVTFGKGKEGKEPDAYHFGKNDYFSLVGTGGTTHRLQTLLNVAAGSGIPVGPKYTHLPKPKNEKAPYWSGRAQSNAIDIRVER